MFTQVRDTVSHTLTIVIGHTNLTLSASDDETHGPSGKEGISNYVWTSGVIRVQGGPIGLVADFVQVQVTTEVMTDNPEVVSIDANGYQYVRVLFLFSRVDGSNFTANRLLMFKGSHFVRFM
jgi:hypothetical protein